VTNTVLILGTGTTAREVAQELLGPRARGYRLGGFLSGHPGETNARILDVPVVGGAPDVLELALAAKATLVLVALDEPATGLPVDELLRARAAGIEVEDAPVFFERLTGRVLLGGLPSNGFVFSPELNEPALVRALRRVVEAAAALVMLAALLPLFALLVLLIRRESPGPAILRQARVGRRGRVFDLVKLRTMRDDAEAETGPVWASPEDDPRLTRLGHLLRKLHLDELPQLVNVVRGEMSLVGPRPERPHFVEKLSQVVPGYDERHAVRPGITGWAQVKFGYGSTIEDSQRKLQFDLYYVKNRSLGLDLAILVETFKVLLRGRKVS
jgi:exopolysaccharide biosynthesis polyprenyl glycosylphosphotransferase